MKASKILLKTNRKFAFLSDKEVETFLTQCAKITGKNPKKVIDKITFKQEVYDLLVRLTKVAENKWEVKWNKDCKAMIKFDFVNNKVSANCSLYDSELKKEFEYDEEYENFYELYV